MTSHSQAFLRDLGAVVAAQLGPEFTYSKSRPFWRQLLRLDAVLGDMPHFQQWIQCLDEWTRTQAEAEIAKFSTVTCGD